MNRIMSFWEKEENKTHDYLDFLRKPHQSLMKNEGIAKSISTLWMWSVTVTCSPCKHKY